MELFKIDPSPTGREERGGVSRDLPARPESRSRRGSMELAGMLALAGVVLALFVTLARISFNAL